MTPADDMPELNASLILLASDFARRDLRLAMEACSLDKMMVLKFSRMSEQALLAYADTKDPLFAPRQPVELRSAFLTGAELVEPVDSLPLEYHLKIQRFNTSYLTVMRDYARWDVFATMVAFGLCRASSEAVARKDLRGLLRYANGYRTLATPTERRGHRVALAVAEAGGDVARMVFSRACGCNEMLQHHVREGVPSLRDAS